MVIIAMAIFGLLVFIGLTIDAGILYIGIGHLRRAVDTASLAAASQFREGRRYADLQAVAEQIAELNNVPEAQLTVKICSDGRGWDLAVSDPQYNVVCTSPRRKLVYVEGNLDVHFTFLTLLGFESLNISANSRSEAASVDVVLVIDTSNSMTNDAPVGSPNEDPAVCNPTHSCHPFEEVKTAANSFVDRMNFPYDRVAIVTFDIGATIQVPITDARATDAGALHNVIDNLEVSPKRFPGDGAYCTYTDPNYDPSGCTNTSIGGGLRLGGGEFGRQPVRQESVWVVILLTDGAANASEPDPNIPLDVNNFCPPTAWIQPFCRDPFNNTRHSIMTHTSSIYLNPTTVYSPTVYDTDDYARDMADFVACASQESDAAPWCGDSLDYDNDQGGQGALIYSIGLGRLVVNFTACDGSYGGTCDRDSGDALLRYVSAVGDDGDPETDLCDGVPVATLTLGNDSYSCGNYYFSETGTGLNAVFESIASKIFTRLTH